MDIRLNNLNKTIVNCKKCPRLVKFVNKVSTIKRRQNINEIYWGKPVPGFGNLDSKLAIIGLAPAAHGGPADLLGCWRSSWARSAPAAEAGEGHTPHTTRHSASRATPRAKPRPARPRARRAATP